MNSKNQGIEMLKGSFDKILSTAIKITRDYNSEYIPLNTLKTITDKAKLSKGSVKGMSKFVKLYNELVVSLYDCSESYCKENDLVKGLPMPVLKMFINQIKINL